MEYPWSSGLHGSIYNQSMNSSVIIDNDLYRLMLTHLCISRKLVASIHAWSCLAIWSTQPVFTDIYEFFCAYNMHRWLNLEFCADTRQLIGNRHKQWLYPLCNYVGKNLNYETCKGLACLADYLDIIYQIKVTLNIQGFILYKRKSASSAHLDSG